MKFADKQILDFLEENPDSVFIEAPHWNFNLKSREWVVCAGSIPIGRGNSLREAFNNFVPNHLEMIKQAKKSREDFLDESLHWP